MGKTTICLCENKDAGQLRSNCEADQRLCFRYTDNTIPLLVLKYKISSLYLSSVTVKPGLSLGLCQTWSETQTVGFLMQRPTYHFLRSVTTQIIVDSLVVRINRSVWKNRLQNSLKRAFKKNKMLNNLSGDLKTCLLQVCRSFVCLR